MNMKRGNLKFFFFLLTLLLPMAGLAQDGNVRLKVVSFNVRSFEPDFDVKPYAELLRGLNADIICLNEVENRSSRQMVGGKYRDVVQDLANELGMFGLFGYSYHLGNKDGRLPEKDFTYTTNELYGNAILSRYPVMFAQAMQLPRPQGSSDQRGVLVTEILLPSMKQVRVAVTHLDHVGGQMEQAEVLLTDKVLSSTLPTLLLGDLNVWPYNPVIQRLGTKYMRLDNDMATYQSGIKLDYVLGTKDKWRMISSEVLPRTLHGKELSDHAPLVSVVELVN